MTAHLRTLPSSSWSLQTTLIGLIQDGDESAYRQEVKEQTVWCSFNNLELNKLKTMEMIVDFRKTPPLCKSTVTAVESFRFLGTPISQDLKWDNHIESMVKKGPAEAVLPSPAEEVQPATRAVDTVLICHHWIHPLHVNNCLVQLSYQIWPQKTTEGSPDCWANHWYNPPHSPGNVLIQSEQKDWQNHSGPLTSSTLPLWTVTVWSTLQSSEHQNDQTQKQFLHPSNPWSHEHLTLNVEHTTLLYNYLFTTHTYFFHFKFAHVRPHT